MIVILIFGLVCNLYRGVSVCVCVYFLRNNIISIIIIYRVNKVSMNKNVFMYLTENYIKKINVL